MHLCNCTQNAEYLHQHRKFLVSLQINPLTGPGKHSDFYHCTIVAIVLGFPLDGILHYALLSVWLLSIDKILFEIHLD